MGSGWMTGDLYRLFRGTPVSRNHNSLRGASRRTLHLQAVLADPTPGTSPSVKPLSRLASDNLHEFSSNVQALKVRVSKFLKTIANRASSNYPELATLLGPDWTTLPQDDSSYTAPKGAIQPLVPTTRSLEVDKHGTDNTSPLSNFLQRADRLEVLYATLVSDLSNMAYEAEKVDEAALERHGLTFISSNSKPLLGPITQDKYERSSLQKMQSQAEAKSLEELPNGTTIKLMPVHDSTQYSSLLQLSSSSALMIGNDLDLTLKTFENPEVTCDSDHTSLMGSMEEKLDNGDLKQLKLHNQCLSPLISSISPSSSVPDISAAPIGPEPSPPPPAAWFVADDVQTKVRYIIIQGSTTVNHWAINLSFDPVGFENEALGVRVHRGVYEAALQLYPELEPLVIQHVISGGPQATVCLGGHSLGGSLASMLMLMLVHRKAIPPTALSPCYTFGAPAVFCAGGGHTAKEHCNGTNDTHHCDNCMLNCSGEVRAAERARDRLGETGGTHHQSLLGRMGLPDGMINNIVMHKDIVPRAFVCDYTIVADLLKKVPSFKEHLTLQASHQHKHMYNFIGKVMVIRPDDGAHFVRGDASHPMLPDEAGLYKLQEDKSMMMMMMIDQNPHNRSASTAAATGYQCRKAADNKHQGLTLDSVSSLLTKKPTSLGSALLAFMNHPHPLSSLSSAGSYGPDGAISRYHNPDNYTKGLSRLVGGFHSPHEPWHQMQQGPDTMGAPRAHAAAAAAAKSAARSRLRVMMAAMAQP